MDRRDTGTATPPAGDGADRGEMSPVKKALVEIRRLNRELRDERARRNQPVALVGMGMRLPGGVSRTGDLARVLREGREAVGPMPRDRWDHEAFHRPGPPSPGRYYVDRGGFLGGVDLFDPEFFGIAPLEAGTMDPQQRLLLETAWEAIEDAALPADSLRASRTGVFLGIGTTDYHRAVLADPGTIDTYASTGTSFSVASGRIAYLLDLRGPALSIDTACSSSLVAVHLACRSLRTGECDLALAGGVSLMLSPEITINFCQAGMLSPDGRCKTFDAAADGYVRSEGCGVVVLKRLDDAVRDGDRVLAVVRGTAVNQDGRSSGLTAPSGPAQEAVVRAALADAGLTPDDIGYVEAHGTGTSLGDPIEVRALGAVFSGGDRPVPLRIGSAKTNFGHLEAAAGIAGLMKAALALQDGTIPPHLHLDTPNPHIPWDEIDVEVATTPTPLDPTGGARRAGVSSFGFSGTNAHVILEEAPPTPTPAAPGPERPLHLLTLSAPDAGGLKALAARYVAHLQDTDDAFADVCFTANTGRTHFDRRIAVVAAGADEAAAALSAWIQGREAPELIAGTVDAGVRSGATAFVFPAEAPEFAALADSSPTVRRALERWHTDEGGAAAVARQHALSELWRAWGLHPDVITARGTGHRAAAVAAGLLTVADVGAPAGVGTPGTAAPTAPVRYLVAGKADDSEPVVVSDAAAWRATVGDGTDGPGPGATLATEDAGLVLVMGRGEAAAAPGATVLSPPADGPLGWRELLESLARAYVAGARPDWRGFEEGRPRRRVPLPSYPFQRRRFWLEDRPPRSGRAPGAAGAGGRGIERPSGGDPWAETAAAARRRAALAPLELNVGAYPRTWAALNALTLGVGRNVVAGLGVFDEAGARAGVDDLVQRNGIDPLYRRILARWLSALEADGALRRTEGGWEAVAPLAPVELAPLWRDVEEALENNPALLAYVRNSAEKAEGVLTGRISALETLFPGGSFDLAADLYESATQLRYVNGIAAGALEAFVAARPPQAPVRVLEVGAGTGGTTSSLVPVLPADRSRYDYSDVSDVFLDWGRSKFASVPFLHTRRFDLEADPGAQGVEPASYDVIVGSNVVHAVRDLPATLERMRTLLAPGGLLLLVESTGHLPWHDITTGLIEGWQHFDDGLRTDTPLLPVPAWLELLAGAGFRASAAAPGPDSPAGVLAQHVILAVNQGESALGPPGSTPSDAAATGDVAPGGSPSGAGDGGAPAEVDLAARLADAVGREREEVVAGLVRDCVMEVLRSDPDRPPSKDARLMELGLDSLMAVRLRNLLQTRLGLQGGLPSTLVFDHPTIRHITTLVLARLGAGAPGGPETPAPSPDDGARRRELAELSDEEAEARLLERLERGEP